MSALLSTVTFGSWVMVAQADSDIPFMRKLMPSKAAKSSSFGTSALGDTLYVGYKSSSTDGQKVGVGATGANGDGLWDFDTGIANTDSTQGWKAVPVAFASDATASRYPTPDVRPFWYQNWGNEANIGDTDLWRAREAAGRQYVRTGAVTIWHVDNMNFSGNGTITGAGSAWCGLRAPGDNTEIDPVTGTALTGDLQYEFFFGGLASTSAYPGYANQWDQILYRDVSVNADGANTLEFDYEIELDDDRPGDLGGDGWFNPDTESPGNFVLNPVDSLMVWVGLPKETGINDTNRRPLSQVINFGSAFQPVKVFAIAGTETGGIPDVVAGNSGVLALPDLGTGTTTYRIAFQLKTNRLGSDETVVFDGTDTQAGAALIDNVELNGGSIGTFDADGDIKARFIHDGAGGGTPNSPSDSWIATGEPPDNYGHIHNAYSLPYAEDPCGPLGDPNRPFCFLDDNIATTSRHDDLDAFPHGYGSIGDEAFMSMISPTIDFTGPRAAAQGTGAIISGGYDLFRMQYDTHTGANDTDTGVFFNIGAAYNSPATVQAAGDVTSQTWSPQIVEPAIFNNPDPQCVTFSTDVALDPFIPAPSTLDSLRLHFWTQTRCKRFELDGCGAVATAGNPEGAYFDNMTATFTTGAAASFTVQLWQVLQDTYTVNAGGFSFGSAEFDTTTAHIKTALNNAPAGEATAGVTPGDSSVVNASFGTDTRVDLVFRIKPGPGNYNTAGNINSGLIEKDPSRPFWASYLAAPGPVGAGNHFGGTRWDKDTWNSARMDSADGCTNCLPAIAVGNIAPLVARNWGIPVVDLWAATLHEDDPKFNTLKIARRQCYLVDPSGSNDESNVCCDRAECTGPPFSDTYPPAAYPSAEAWADTITYEDTKILPDGYFSPGTHIEYFYRRSDASNPFANVGTAPDSNVAASQNSFGPDFDGYRWKEIGVLPDRWKDSDFGGAGDPCMLVVDAADRHGDEMQVTVVLDKLGYGKNNGAGQGWLQPNLGPLDPDNPANFVRPNLGQKGLLYDHFDVSAGESGEAARPGCRLATKTSQPAGKDCYLGPSEDMLADMYDVIIWHSEDLSTGVFHDGVTNQEQAKDVALVDNFLLGASLGDERAAWISGDGVAYDLTHAGPDGGASSNLLTLTCGTDWVAEEYRVASANFVNPAVYDPVGGSFNGAAEYGFNNSCVLFPDVIDVSTTGLADGAVIAALYEDASHRGGAINPGTYVASVYKPADPGASRYYATLVSGHEIPSILGDQSAADGDIIGRIRFADDALKAFNICVSAGAPVQVGNTPGLNVNFVRGAFPNPAPMGRATINYSLAQPAKVTIRFYNVAGRLVHEVEHSGVAGPNTVTWNGATSTGMRASAGVYFYRLSAPGITFQNNSQRMVLLGANN